MTTDKLAVLLNSPTMKAFSYGVMVGGYIASLGYMVVKQNALEAAMNDRRSLLVSLQIGQHQIADVVETMCRAGVRAGTIAPESKCDIDMAPVRVPETVR